MTGSRPPASPVAPEGRAGAPAAVAAAAVVALAVVGLALWEGMLHRQQAAAHWSVGLSVLATFALAVVAGRGRQQQTSRQWLTGRPVEGHGAPHPGAAYRAGIALWAILIAAVVVWDLNSFLHQAHDLPTLSYYAGRVTRFWWGRALFFAAWLALGLCLALGDRVPPGQGQTGAAVR